MKLNRLKINPPYSKQAPSLLVKTFKDPKAIIMTNSRFE